MKRPYLPLPAVQAATTKILSHKLTKYCSTKNILTPGNDLLYGIIIVDALTVFLGNAHSEVASVQCQDVATRVYLKHCLIFHLC